MSDRNNLTKQQFERLIIRTAGESGVVDDRAIEDPEGYDNGLTVGRLSAMAEYLYAELRIAPVEPNAPQLVTVCKWIVDTAREIPGQANEVAVTREFIGKLRQLIESRPTEQNADGHHCPSCQCPELDQAGFPANRTTKP